MTQRDPAADPLLLSLQLTLAGRYSIDRELGRGGMGIVYLAREVLLDRLVAIKLLPPEKARQTILRERFLREARLAAKLSHPNIIPIHAVDDTREFVFYVMAYVEGETLAQRVRTRGPLPGSEAVRILREASWALAHAHSQGLVHRDVKPDNILLETATGRVLVADFGIAAAVGDAMVDGVSGTPEFMSPEQALGKEIDARSDLYGLGVTAFYALSGRLPFEGSTSTEVLAKQVTEPPPPLASLGLAVPRKVALLVDRCLAKDPAHRPVSAESLAEQFGLALEQRRELPVALRAFVKRNGRLDGGGTLLVPFALLGGSIGVSAWLGLVAGFSTFVLGMTAGPFAYFVGAARRLSLLGFAHQDLAPAFKAEMEQSREEHAVEHLRGVSKVENILRATSRVTGVMTGLSVIMFAGKVWLSGSLYAFLMTPTLVEKLQMVEVSVAVCGSIFVASSVTYLSLFQRRRDIDTEVWLKLWTGGIGKLAFSLARKMLGRRNLGSITTHRATELSLGMAAEQLYESLPKESRRALGDLPALLRRLQADAQTLRKRHDEIQEALSSAGDSAAEPEYHDFRADRDAIHAKLGEAVGALETIRLNLLRLHAGSATVEGLTTHLGLAEEVSVEVERLIAAQAEMERGIEYPRETAATPG